jgi:N-acetylmuramoyl-L-alanine amidase
MKIAYQIFWISLLSVSVAPSFAAPQHVAPARSDRAHLIGVRSGPQALKTRVVFTFDNIPDYTTTALHFPERLVIDLKNTELATSLNQAVLKGLPIDTIRSAVKPQHALELVLSLKKPMHHDVFTLPASQPYGERLVIDFADLPNKIVGAKPLSPAPKKSVVTQTDESDDDLAPVVNKVTKRAAKTKPKAVPFPSVGQRDIVVVIDPGHGGKDSGANGLNGTHEKDVVLAISRALQNLLQKEPGMRAVLTRRGDYYIGLRERLNIARKDKADMFIAIHADAFKNPYSSGSSVFALSARGASSEAARWLAEKENYSELGGVNLDDKTDVLRSVLLDLSQTGTISLSLQLGGNLLQELGKISHLHHATVEQARFVVLKSPDIPSVLVETGFISNEDEEDRLGDPIYQQQVAQALLKGIRRYFAQYPPPGTLLAAKREH